MTLILWTKYFLSHSLNNVWVLNVLLLIGLIPIWMIECFQFFLTNYLNLFLFWIMVSLRALFWSLFCPGIICFFWVLFFLNIWCHFTFMLMTHKCICPYRKKDDEKGFRSLSACLSSFSLFLHLMIAKPRLLFLGPQVFQVLLTATWEIWSPM